MPEAEDRPEEPHDETLLFAQRAWNDASREHREQQGRRDRALNQLSTIRTVSWAMATVLGGAVVLAGDPLSAAFEVLGVQISLAITMIALTATIAISVVPNFWPRWADPPGFEDWARAETMLTYIAALWRMAELAAVANRRNAGGVMRLEYLVRSASVLSAISAVGLLSAATLAISAVL